MDFLALAFASVAVVPLRADVEIKPAAKAVDTVDEPTNKLFQIVTGATWNYLWHHTTVEIAFAEDGTMAKAPWPGARWKITGPHAVTVTTDKPTPREMVLHFINSQQFSCKDWSGDAASGTRRKANPPQGK